MDGLHDRRPSGRRRSTTSACSSTVERGPAPGDVGPFPATALAAVAAGPPPLARATRRRASPTGARCPPPSPTSSPTPCRCSRPTWACAVEPLAPSRRPARGQRRRRLVRHRERRAGPRVRARVDRGQRRAAAPGLPDGAMRFGLGVTFDEYLAARRRRFVYVRRARRAARRRRRASSRRRWPSEGFSADGTMPGEDHPGTPSSAYNTQAQNVTGHPALSVPAGVCPNGVPFGLQITGPRFADELVLGVGRGVGAGAALAARGARLRRRSTQA